MTTADRGVSQQKGSSDGMDTGRALSKAAGTVRDGSAEQSPRPERAPVARPLTKGTPSVTDSIADAITTKDEDLFFLTRPDGSVPLGGSHGYGLYFHDCRYLNGYEFRIAGGIPNSLVATCEHGFTALFELTNPDIKMADGGLIHKEDLGVQWVRIVDGTEVSLHEEMTFRNYGMTEARFPISLTFQSSFEDIFDVRGVVPKKLGKLSPPRWEDGALCLEYAGGDGIYRSLWVYLSPAPEKTEGTTAHFTIDLRPREKKQLLISLAVGESARAAEVGPRPHKHPDLKAIERYRHISSAQWLGKQTEVRTDSLLLNGILERSLLDVRVLRSNVNNQEYFAAGLPWFGTLFGRDSTITALQMLAYEPQIAEHTARVLAGYQCERVDHWRDGQPGKILHELRIGEMAHMKEVPYDPYYGSIDSTILFLILIGRHAAWTGDLRLFNDLRDNIARALQWMDKYGDMNGDGYIEYASTSDKGLTNQGWKDSGDGIVNADGSLATAPIALVEVQGYAYMAWQLMAELYRRAGEAARAEELEKKAAALRAKFNKDFWLADKGYYALALQKGGRPAAVLASNPGQAMWTGIVDPDKAKLTVERLMGADMFGGWGVRTLSENEVRYNPIGYHLGTVWPHDNSIIVAGFKRYGHDDEMLRIFSGIVEAAMRFPHYRLPELFAGFRRDGYETPVNYPVACHPQAWAAGTVPFILESALGLVPEAFEGRLRIVRPALPVFVGEVTMRRLQVGKATVDLRFERGKGGAVTTKVLQVEGKLDVVTE